MSAVAMGALTASDAYAQVVADGALRPGQYERQVRYHLGDVKVEANTQQSAAADITINPESGHISLPPGVRVHKIEVIASIEVDGKIRSREYYQLVVPH